MQNSRVFKMKFADLYPLYIQKAERKNRTKAEVDQIISWLVVSLAVNQLKHALTAHIVAKQISHEMSIDEPPSH
jgi:hypothetical protein